MPEETNPSSMPRSEREDEATTAGTETAPLVESTLTQSDLETIGRLFEDSLTHLLKRRREMLQELFDKYRL